jgi:hypothetical protein
MWLKESLILQSLIQLLANYKNVSVFESLSAEIHGQRIFSAYVKTEVDSAIFFEARNTQFRIFFFVVR